jgi:hypothetical protein
VSGLDAQGRPEPPLDGEEADTLKGFLEFQRATFRWKCSELDSAGLRATVGVSLMTLGGMMKHLALVEDWWFSQVLFDRRPAPPWDAVDFDLDPDWEWRTAGEDSPEGLRSLWEENVTRARSSLDEALGTGGLGQLAQRTSEDRSSPSLRWIMCHMVEEYARHNGHADLLRESIDGQTGE